MAWNNEHLTDRWPMTSTFAPSAVEIAVAVLGTLLLLEATRRLMGWTLVIVAVIALLYSYLGEHIPWKQVSHRPFTFVEIVDFMYLTLDGIWGSALGVAATYIAAFCIYGAFAEKVGVTNVFLQLALAIFGHVRGGPAKVAIFSSGMFGTVSGSTVTNIYAMGQFTIPMMKRQGYKGSLAGAVEALAGNGGQIMPPVLGAAAFIVAANLGMPYAKLALASIIPAFLYYCLLWWNIHLLAYRDGLRGIPKEEKPSVAKVIVTQGYLVTPLLLLIGLFVYGFSPMPVALFVIVYTIVISWFKKETRIGPKEFFEALEQGAKDAVMIVVICAVIGFVIGAFMLTGLGLNISGAIISLAGNNYYLVLLFVFLACIVLGTGMNTVADFILVSVVAVPALTALGVHPLVANMFVFYGALLSHITPPVCLGIYAAAAIADADPWATAIEGLKMGVVAYLLPFLIALSPALLLLGGPLEVANALITNLIGGGLIVAGVQGWLLSKPSAMERALSIAAGAGLILPMFEAKIVGAVLGVVVLCIAMMLRRRRGKRIAHL
ncbi:MAG: TRAP transporter fused permease subunit [Alphaproteobacteria bacterium]|nr:TRAP transporter fused permease subunit [Alphaproteobacteria bacterium]